MPLQARTSAHSRNGFTKRSAIATGSRVEESQSTCLKRLFINERELFYSHWYLMVIIVSVLCEEEFRVEPFHSANKLT